MEFEDYITFEMFSFEMAVVDMEFFSPVCHVINSEELGILLKQL